MYFGTEALALALVGESVLDAAFFDGVAGRLVVWRPLALG